jgi:AraC-like DNA-binding protein
MIAEELLFDSDGNVDVEAIRDERETRNVPQNPPPTSAQPRWLDGKCIAQIAVSECINCRSWHVQAVMRFLIDSANRQNGACYPSNETIAQAVHCSERTIQRATRWWCGHAYRVNGEMIPFLSIAVKGRERSDGTKESNAYHIGWLPLIAFARDHHYRLRVRRHAAAILKTTNVRCVA